MKRLTLTAVVLLLLIATALPASAIAAEFPGKNWATYLEYTYVVPNGGPITVNLVAGQHEDVGSVRVWNIGATLFVEYNIDVDDVYFLETHVAIADSLEGIPQKNGNPTPGKFPYKATYKLADEVTNPDPIEISLTGYSGGVIFIATHAALSNGETAWSGEEEPGLPVG